MFDSMTPDQQFNLLVIAAVVVLPFIVLSVVGFILEVRDRAYARGFDEAYTWARRAYAEGRQIV
jgi:hypothetical protein